MTATRIRLQRAYEDPQPDDGHRVLVDRVWPRGRLLPRPGGRVTVRVGSPFRVADELPPGVERGDAKALATAVIMRRIAALLPERQQGVYRA